MDVLTRLELIRERISDAGGDPDRTTIVAVTKGRPLRALREAVAAGVADIGENYAQELSAKVEELELAEASAGPSVMGELRWHFIGQLQRNKVRSVARLITLWQSVDRLALGREIARLRPGAAVLVQVNLTEDPARGGMPPDQVPDLVAALLDEGLDVRGLMAVGPPGGPDAAGPGFGAVSALADRLGLAERSMGMSSDLEVAVRNGATMIRIGAALFGAAV